MTDFIRDWLLDPIALLFLLSILTGIVLFRRRSRSRRRSGSGRLFFIVLIWFALFLLCSAPVAVNPLLALLEDQYSDHNICDAGSHIIVLGGGVDSRASSAEEFDRMSSSTLSRATAGYRIALSEAQLRLVVAGGPVRQIAEADVVANYWVALGISGERILRDSESVNTRENASNAKALLHGEVIEGPVRLITSALHMPRALRTFEKAFENTDTEFCPIAVDRQALKDLPFWAWMPQTTALIKFDAWLHEIVALSLYRLKGWI